MLTEGYLYAAFSGSDDSLIKINTTTGQEVWTVVLSDEPWDNSITMDDNGRLFLALYGDASMNAYYASNGSLIWQKKLHDNPLSFTAYHEGKVFIADTDGFVFCFDAASGGLLWETRVGDKIDISSPTLSGGLLFIGTRDFEEGAFFALQEATGEILWRYPVGASVTAPPTIVDGMMLCGVDDWHLYAFDIGLGQGMWTHHRYDCCNTAYSPDGLTTWQYVQATCTSENEQITCVVTNHYDHDVKNVTLQIPGGVCYHWFDASGALLQSQSEKFTLDRLDSMDSVLLILKEDVYGDVNGDGIVDVLDLLLVLSAWDQTGSPGWIPEDITMDGVVDVLDLLEILGTWS
jgi:outer membrane protein assembly factor BamB